MSLFRPPYRQIHIIILGSVTLLCYLAVLIWMIILPARSLHPQSAPAIPTTPTLLKSTFSQPLAMAQTGSYDTAWANSGFLLVDVRSASNYDQEHITGAMSIPLAQLRYAQFTDETSLVLYSNDRDELATALTVLAGVSVKDIHTLNATLSDLKKAGYHTSQTEN